MNNEMQVDADTTFIQEFSENFTIALQKAERCLIILEKEPNRFEELNNLKDIFSQQFLSASKLNLVTISESLSDALRIIEKLLDWEYFPTDMSEYFLLLSDRLLYLVKEIELSLFVNLQEAQYILVSMQGILLAKDRFSIDKAVTKAIENITRNIHENTDNLTSSNPVELFGDEIEVETYPDKSNQVAYEIFTPKVITDPLMQARDTISELLKDETIMMLAAISDQTTVYKDSHSDCLLEIGLAINFMLNEPIDTLGFAKGICLHDIALSPYQSILNKPGALTPEELVLVKKHPSKGVSIAKSLQIHEDGLNVISHHHEKVNGRGYPYELKDGHISDAGKLAGIVDSYHAMVSVRPHKKFTRNSLRAIAEINACVNSHYNSYWVKQFNIFMKKHWLAQSNRKPINDNLS